MKRGLTASAVFAGLALSCGARTPLATGELSDPEDASVADASVDVAARDAQRDSACTPLTLTLTIPSTSPWTATGIQLAGAKRVRITATGTIRYGGGSQQLTGPNGGNFDGQLFFSTAVLPQAVVVALIGKVGGDASVGSGVPVPEGAAGKGPGFVGASYDRVIPTAGPLFLGFNDQKQAFGDNSGAFQVTIVVDC